MKKLVFLLISFFFLQAHSQTVKYRILSNDPPGNSRFNLNLELAQMEAITKSLDGSSFNIGLWGHFEVLPGKIAVQATGRRSVFTFGSLGVEDFPPSWFFEAGGYYVLSVFSRIKPVKVTLKTTFSFLNDSYTEKYIRVPAKQNLALLARGGFYYNSYGTSTDFIDDDFSFLNNPEYAVFTSIGIYAGISLRTFNSIFVETVQHGKHFHSKGRDIYFDLLFLPSNTFIDFERNDFTNVVNKFMSSAPVGFRTGFKLFEIDPKKDTGKRFGMSVSFEFGHRPYTGLFFNGGIGISLVKK